MLKNWKIYALTALTILNVTVFCYVSKENYDHIVHLHDLNINHNTTDKKPKKEKSKPKIKKEKTKTKEKKETKKREKKATSKTTNNKKQTNSWNSLGVFEITGYCGCPQCSGEYGNYTSLGRIAQPNHTIAVDPTVIPYDTKVKINGQVYIAEDCGGAVKGNRIDIYFTNHEEASQFGLQNHEVFIKGQ